MTWNTNRKERLPPDWDARRAWVLERDGHRCVALLLDGTRCRARATDVDHIHRGDNHDPTNLQSLCEWHHDRKSAMEGVAARRPRERSQRPPERHPGLLP